MLSLLSRWPFPRGSGWGETPGSPGRWAQGAAVRPGCRPGPGAERTGVGFSGSEYLQGSLQSLKRCLSGAPALAVAPAGQSGSAPGGGGGSGGFLRPLASCRVGHLVCHQSVSVQPSFFPGKQHRTKAHFQRRVLLCHLRENLPLPCLICGAHNIKTSLGGTDCSDSVQLRLGTSC